MKFFSIIITLCVGLIMAGGAALTYKHRMAETEGNIVVASPTQFVKNVAAQRAALPKWDDKNWKGLEHKGGVFRSASSAPKQNVSKQTAAR